MKSNYKKLGQYIRIVDERNKKLEDLPLMGLSVQKKFFPTIANLVGTDMSTYKIVYKNQFTYIADTSRRGDKIAIALNENFEKMLVSQAYTPFEVIDKNELLPEYLMMWFRRPEFDRYARFKSHGSAREIFDWGEMCDTELPIPSIEKQKELVKEYHILVDRIDLNNKLITKLEETAQAIYKQWFVDFEFPDANGLPYKSNGGEMIESELGEIPKDWKFKNIKNWGNVITGKTPSSSNPDFFGNDMLFVTPGDFKNYGKYVLGAYRKLSKSGITNLKNKVLKVNSVIVTCIGSDMGKIVLTREECITNQQMNSIEPKKEFYSDYLYYYLTSISNELKSIALGGSTMPMINKTDFELIEILMPDDNLLQEFHKILIPINNTTWNNARITNASSNLKDLLLSKLATIND